MLKKILKYIGIFLLTLSLAAYFVFAGILEKRGRKNEICKTVKVTIADLETNRFVSEDDVLDILGTEAGKLIGSNVHDININDLEILLSDRSAIKKSRVSITRDGTVFVKITQRKPVLRLQYDGKGFYIDETDYIFPTVETFTSYVPLVTGNIPVDIKKGFRGRLAGDDSVWVRNITSMAEYLSRHIFWNSQIQQIYVAPNSDLILSPRVGDQSVIFGPPEDIGDKFTRLEAFYDIIAPAEGWNRYHTVNLKYKNQIICE